MADLLGVALLSIKGLCRTAAGLAIYVSECMCKYDVMTDLNGFSAVVPNRKLILPHSLSPSVSNPLDARLATLRKVALPCRRVGQRRIGRLKRRHHKISNRTNKDKNVEADSCRNGCSCCCCCCLDCSSLSTPFDLDSFVDCSCLSSSFYSSSVCCASGAAGAKDNHTCVPVPEPSMKLHNDHCTPMHASCLGLLERVKGLSSAECRLVSCQDRAEFTVVSQDPRSLVSIGTSRRSSSKRHVHRNLQRQHTNRFLPSIVSEHRTNLLGGRATHRHLQNARSGSKRKEESSKQTIFFNTPNANGNKTREEGKEKFKVGCGRNNAKSNLVYGNKSSPKKATSMTSRKCLMRGRNAVWRFKVYKTSRFRGATCTSSFLQYNPLALPQALGSVENFHGGTQHIRQLFMPKQCPFQTADTPSRQESTTRIGALQSVVSIQADNQSTEMQRAFFFEKIYSNDSHGERPVRFQGGGAERLQCFVCLAYKSTYVPHPWSDEYVMQCRTCGRGACNMHGSWEVGQFHCTLCHRNDAPLSSGAKDTFAVRCISKAFQKQKLLHRNEEAFHDLMLMLCGERARLQTEATDDVEDLTNAQPLEAASAALTWQDAQQLVGAILLSRLGTAEDTAQVLGQNWVPSWDGWKELQQCTTERCCVAIAERLCDIAEANAPDRRLTDNQALQALAAEGLMRQKAQSHGVNNCLIDSLMLCLSNECILPVSLVTEVATRRRVAAACRKHLIQEIGTVVAPSGNGFFPYLDAHRDGHTIVAFLLQRFRAVARANMLIHVHDRFGEYTADPDRNKIFLDLGFHHSKEHALHLHIYNHTSVQGRGYHFDSLLCRTPVHGAELSNAKETQTQLAATGVHRTDAEQQQHNSVCNTRTEPCDKMEGTEPQKGDQRAEAVFAKMGWRLRGCTFATSWLEALILNLLFHEYLFVPASVCQEARYRLCKACQAHLMAVREQNWEGEQSLDLQKHLASAMSFLVSSNKNLNAEVSVYDATTTDLNVPRHSYTIGQPDSLLVPIFRLYCYQNGQYAALLPDAQPPVQQKLGAMPARSCFRGKFQTAAPIIEPATNASGTNTKQMQDVLQRFCDRRGAKLQITETDACRLQKVWSDKDAEGISFCIHCCKPG